MDSWMYDKVSIYLQGMASIYLSYRGEKRIVVSWTSCHNLHIAVPLPVTSKHPVVISTPASVVYTCVLLLHNNINISQS
jgi:hypothetical protein